MRANALSREQIQSFQEQGFVVARGILNMALVSSSRSDGFRTNIGFPFLDRRNRTACVKIPAATKKLISCSNPI